MSEASPTRQSRYLDDPRISRRSSIDLRQHALLSTTPSISSGQEWQRNPAFAPPASLLNSRRSSLASLVESDLERLGKRRGSMVEVVEEHKPLVTSEPASPEEGSNFQRSLQIDMKGLVGDAVGNMSISPSSRDIVLAARRGLFIIDLEAPLEIPRFLPQGGTWDVADVQWNPHPSRAEYIVSTSSEKLLIWNLLLVGKTSIEFILQAHYRAITDINWHTTECDTVISTGIDSWLWAWDLRETRKPIFGLSAFKAGGTQVKWNRQDANIIASSHADEVLIWDRRKGSLPIKRIKAHDAKIYGIDWAHDRRDELVTCSLDKTIKVWDTSTADLNPKVTVHTAYPVWRARTLPFGRGVLSLAQRGFTPLEMYGGGRSDAPVKRFEGHTDVVKEFVWRKGGEDEYQLITWSKDRTLRFWPLEPEVMEEVGHCVSPNRGRRPSRSERSPSISYRNPPEGIEHLPALSAPVGHRSILAEVRAPLPPRPMHVLNARNQGGTMSRGGPNNNSSRMPMDAITWLSNVKVGERRSSSDGGAGESAEGSRLGEKFMDHYRNTSSDGLAIGSMDPDTDNEDREREKRCRSESLARGEGEVSQSQTQILQDEITSVLKKLQSHKINLEKHDLTKKRTCTLGFQGPWGGSTSVFIRITFIFPRNYPQSRDSSSTPIVDLERNPLTSLKDRAFMLRRLSIIREQQRPCLESCLRFLLFRDNERPGVATPMESESSSSENEQSTVAIGRRKNRDNSSTSQRTVKYLVEPRTSQGTFGPNGELVCFFGAPTRTVKNVLRGLSDPSATPSKEPVFTPPVPAEPVSAPRMFQSPSLISDAVRRLNLAAKDRQQKANEMRRLVDPHNILRIMTNLLTLQAKAKSQVSDGSERRPLGELLKSYALLAAPPRSNVFLGPTTNIVGGDPKVARDYVFGDADNVGKPRESGSGGGLKEVCAQNARFAKLHGRYDHERAFKTLQVVVPSSSQSVPVFDALAVKVVLELYNDFSKTKDIQMLAMLSVLLLQTYDLIVSNSSATVSLDGIDISNGTPKFGGMDYFSLSRGPQTERPPMWPRRPSTPTVPQQQLGTSVPSSTSSRGSWSSLFNTGSMRQFMSGVQDSLKEGLTTPLEGPASASPSPANASAGTTRPRLQMTLQAEATRRPRPQRKEQGMLGPEPKSPSSPSTSTSKSWNEPGSYPLKASPSFSSVSAGHNRRTPLAQVTDPSNTRVVGYKKTIVFEPPIEVVPEKFVAVSAPSSSG
ncbi:hypothetical protein C0991_011438 [Blastosporella zonata]|nr:hypothetical protein C0991_011438 [Blastosporella zonata]